MFGADVPPAASEEIWSDVKVFNWIVNDEVIDLNICLIVLSSHSGSGKSRKINCRQQCLPKQQPLHYSIN